MSYNLLAVGWGRSATNVLEGEAHSTPRTRHVMDIAGNQVWLEGIQHMANADKLLLHVLVPSARCCSVSDRFKLVRVYSL